MAEATKYIGYPYVWGGSSPSTSFDCSGFVCWVYTASGVHNLPRTTAQGIYNQCAIIPSSEAKPGDIIFFTGTYDSGVLSPMSAFMWATTKCCTAATPSNTPTLQAPTGRSTFTLSAGYRECLRRESIHEQD